MTSVPAQQQQGEGPKSRSEVKELYDSTLNHLEHLLDSLVEEVPDVRSSEDLDEVETWLENAAASLVSWSLDIRLEDGDLDLGIDQTLAYQLRQAFNTIRTSSVEAYDALLAKRELAITDTMGKAIQTLKSLSINMRFSMAIERNSGPLQPISELVTSIASRGVGAAGASNARSKPDFHISLPPTPTSLSSSFFGTESYTSKPTADPQTVSLKLGTKRDPLPLQMYPIEPEIEQHFVYPTEGSSSARRLKTANFPLWSNEGRSDTIFPSEISCFLTVTFEEVSKFEVIEIPNFVWNHAIEYARIITVIDDLRESLYKQYVIQRSAKIYHRFASCFVKGHRNQLSHSSEGALLIDDMEILSDMAIRSICGFIHQNPFEMFELRVSCDCSSIASPFTTDNSSNVQKQSGTPFHILMSEVLKEKMQIGRPNITDQRYLSLADQKELVTYRNGDRIIDEDGLSVPAMLHAQKVELKDAISRRPAITLLAVCVFELLPMSFLYHLLCEEPHLSKKLSDSVSSLLSMLTESCGVEICDRNIGRFLENIHKFFPETIKLDYQHSVKNDNAIVPVRHVDRQEPLGHGAFSTVFEVDVDPYYQILTQDITKTYALKHFKTSGRYKAGFDREVAMLLRLARYLQHEHILTHITSWEQNSNYYILYEKAHGNLRQHMREYPGGNFTMERVSWFFYQLRGLSDAIRRVHFFREPDVDLQTGAFNVKRTGVVGYHHDIKPENILAFGSPRDLPTLKLSDFGSGKFTSVKAFNEASATEETRWKGTYTYAGPEHQKSMGKKVARPFDMWALGCLFLELLLWFLDIDKPDGREEFPDMRLSERYVEQSKFMIDTFWTRDFSGAFIVNPAVRYVLDSLQSQHCRDAQAFEELVQIIRQLLVIQPEDRITAVTLFNSIDIIWIKLQDELDQDPTSYTSILQRNGSL